MPGCRKLDASAFPTVQRGRAEIAAYVRHRARPPRACNDNRRVRSGYLWRWALILGMAPAFAVAAALSALL